jgi:UDP-N-acetylglucosamine 2-epimerase (non-hydrolysing)
MRVLVVIGTRPEAIKLAPVVRALEADGATVNCCLTGQHTDLLRPMLDFFRIPVSFDLNVMTPGQTLAGVAARILSGIAGVLSDRTYDWVVVQGDTTTAFAAGLAGHYARVKVAHVEAGLRSFDLAHPFPEEAHRRLIDVFADGLFVPTEQSRQNLLAEGVSPARIHLTGNSGIDALLIARDRVLDGDVPLPVDLPADSQMMLVTAHRRESFGEPLENVFRAVVAAVERRPRLHAVVPLHPNPNVRAAARILEGHPRVHTLPPLAYPEFVAAMVRADVIVTDSGGVQEEAPCLGTPVLVVRETTERPEGVDAGAVELVGTDTRRITARSLALLDHPHARTPKFLYGDGQASRRIAGVIVRGASVQFTAAA